MRARAFEASASTGPAIARSGCGRRARSAPPPEWTVGAARPEDEHCIEHVFRHAVGLPQRVTSVISSTSMFRRYPILIAGAVLLVIFMADIAYLEWSDARDPAKGLILRDAGN